MVRAGLGCPFVGMGASPRTRDLIELIRHGAADFLLAPVLACDLDRTLHRISQRRGVPHAPPPAVAEPAAPTSLSSALATLASGGFDLVHELPHRLKEGEIELPAIAPIAGRIQALLESPEAGVDDVLRVISRDPSIVAGVLRLANSGPYGTNSCTTDLREACLRLGNRRVLALAQQLVIGGLYVLGREPYSTVVADLWRNTLVCARGARQLAGSLRMEDPEAVFVAALLHNIGELALLRILCDLPGPIAPGADGLREVSRVLQGAHEEFGAAVLEGWGMPARFVSIARRHHQAAPLREGGGEARQRLVCRLAWTVALREGYVYLPDQVPPPIEPLIAELGLGRDELDAAFRDCRQWVSSDGTLNGTAA